MANRMLFFEIEEREKQGILFLLEHDLKYYLKNFGYQGFKELKEQVKRLREIALQDNNSKMIRIYSTLLYLVNNLEDYYFSRLFEKFFEVNKD